ncbi:unnamed protein product [Spirodela intermedia]|uniref:UspA domain-containing protein n=2 Tax=Spirodela intermedia TaxID=51605 RepID=A0A7I8IBY0_SPIIN|nr:unnamed protein product [Spirodela intermedia]CAA6654391.1 unnamed protein product [Spirodela intermedia]CAA7388966.1 unnamed protein product [Spirodela intermedia]
MEKNGEAAAEWRVAVAVDGSEESMHALGWSLRNVLSASAKNTVVLLYARPPPPIYPSTDTSGYLFSDEEITTMEQYNKEVENSVIDKAQTILKNHDNIKVEKRIATGDARDVICDTVDRVGADLLVMGSHGYGFVKRALLGSVSDYCIHHAKCPVLIVKRP